MSEIKSCIDYIKGLNDGINCTGAGLKAEEEYQEILDILRFYACKTNYIEPSFRCKYVTDIEFDRGERARELLKKLK